MVVAPDRRVQGHHEPVVTRHACHLEHHVTAERETLSRCRRPRARRRIDACCLGLLQRLSTRIGVAVIGGHRAMRDEVAPPRLQGGNEPGVAPDVRVRRFRQPGRLQD